MEERIYLRVKFSLGLEDSTAPTLLNRLISVLHAQGVGDPRQLADVVCAPGQHSTQITNWKLLLKNQPPPFGDDGL
jgi:hypothetical protein